MIEPIYDHADLTLDQIERQVITNRLAHFEGSKPKASKSLGISEKTLYNKLDIYEKEGPKLETEADKNAREQAWLARQRGAAPTMEKMTQEQILSNPNETYGAMKSPLVVKPGEMSRPAPVIPVITPPVVQLPKPVPIQPKVKVAVRKRG